MASTFFVLSGASLMYAYGGQLEDRRFDFKKFLLLRYFRLAPLYILLMLLVLPWKIIKEGATLALLKKFLLNGFFAFGFFDPASSSMLVGGWSLGIEAIYYLMFPLLGFLVLRGKWFFVVFPVLLLVQMWWVTSTIGSQGVSGKYRCTSPATSLCCIFFWWVFSWIFAAQRNNSLSAQSDGGCVGCWWILCNCCDQSRRCRGRVAGCAGCCRVCCVLFSGMAHRRVEARKPIRKGS